MIKYFITINNDLICVDSPQKGCWILAEQPTEAEIQELIQLGIKPSLIKDSVDENEKSHIAIKEDQVLMVFDIPLEVPDLKSDQLEFYTMPIGFIVTPDYVISLTSFRLPAINNFKDYAQNDVATQNQYHMVFSILYFISSRFTIHLDNIDKFTNNVDLSLKTKVTNDSLLSVLSLQKSLVYFTNALSSTKGTLEKLLRGKALPIADENQEILQDTLVEIDQAIETASIYTEVLSSTMDAVSSIVSNNMNATMKALTSITLVLSIPTMIFGFYGMNVTFSEGSIHFAIPLVVTAIISGLLAWILYKNDFF